jgi:UDP:flavonoid glycosyltransferase YjiC (YdhE family)
MRFLFVSAQLPGHLDWGGYLRTAAELVQRGHTVLWATGESMRASVEAQGVPCHVLSETGWRWPPPAPLQPNDVASPEEYQQLRMVRSLDQWLEAEKVKKATAELIDVARSFKPDLIGAEMFMAAAGIAAEVVDVPFAVIGWPAVRTHLSGEAVTIANLARERTNLLLDEFHVTGTNWEQEGPPALLSPHLHLTYWSPRWFSGLPLLPQTAMVGGVAPEAQPWKSPWLNHLPMDQPWIFITLGTSFSQDVNFYLASAHAADQVGGLPIVTTGDQLTQASLEQLQERLPKQTILTVRVDFSEVLPYAAAAIHHGGAGTTHALVTHAIPQIVVPHAADQSRQGEGVTRSGVGYRIPPKQVTIPVLVQALQNMLPSDSPVRRNAIMLKEEFTSLGGIEKAADLLEEVGRLRD